MTDQQPKQQLVSYHGGHTLFDGDGEPEQFVEAAIEKGFLALGFSEHMPPPSRYNYSFYPDPVSARKSFASYVETIRALQATYRSDLTILVGVETEYLPDEEGYVSHFLDEFDFDYVVGSVHFVAGMGFDASKEVYDEAAQKCGGYEELAVEYYRTIRGLLATNVTNVLGHLDLIDIFAPEHISGAAVREAEDQTLEAAKAAGVILDVNARGLLKPVKRVYPTVELLGRAHQLGIPATLGDDSHAPDQVGARLDQSMAVMRAAGYDAIATLLLEEGRLILGSIPLIR